MEKLDLVKQNKALYTPPAKAPVVVDVPGMSFLMIDGTGDPATAPAYKEAVQVLYSTAYTLKFTVKKSLEIDYGVLPLEGLWWMAGEPPFPLDRRDEWQWTMMIGQPDFVTAEMAAEAAREVERKKGLPGVERLRYERFAEGRSAQVMHIGPYAAEMPTVARLHAFIEELGCRPRGKHHEIYLGDPNRTAPEKLRTVLRQPIE